MSAFIGNWLLNITLVTETFRFVCFMKKMWFFSMRNLMLVFLMTLSGIWDFYCKIISVNAYKSNGTPGLDKLRGIIRVWRGMSYTLTFNTYGLGFVEIWIAITIQRHWKSVNTIISLIMRGFIMENVKGSPEGVFSRKILRSFCEPNIFLVWLLL